MKRDRKSPIEIIISTIYPPLADKVPKSIHTRVYTRLSLVVVRERYAEAKPRTTGAVSRDSKGARRGQAWVTRDHHDKSSGQTSVQFISL